MAISETVQMTGNGPTSSFKIDLSRFTSGVGLICTVDAGASANYTVEISGDNVHWNSHDILVGLNISANSNLAYPVLFMRLNGAVSNGSVTLVAIQAQ